MSRGRAALAAVLGALLLLAAALLPSAWYDSLPPLPRGIPEPSVRGTTLLRVTLALEGIALLFLAAARRWTPGVPLDRPPPAAPAPVETRRERSRAAALLLAVSGLGLVLRVVHLGSDFWIDEIMTIEEYGGMRVLDVLATYSTPNNHLLNTLLEKASIGAFGESEWAARLPAVAFGAATIPLAYWLARFVASRWESLGVALLVAVSYHHVFFSQNARGYAAYLFLSVAATGLFARALEEDRPRDWALYVAVMTLDFAALLVSAFVFAGHALVAAGALAERRRRGRPVRPLVLRLVVVFAIVGLLAFQIYALALPRILATFGHTFTAGGSGYVIGSGDLSREVAARLAAGFGSAVALIALPVLAVAAAGFAVAAGRRWTLVAGLALPLAITAAYVVARRYGFAPRLFLLVLPLGALCGVLGAGAVTRAFARLIGRPEAARPLAAAAVLIVAAASSASLPAYYRTPKQPYRASIAYLESTRAPGDPVLVTYLAWNGYRYYLPRMGVADTASYRYVSSAPGLDSLVARLDPRRPEVVVTLERVLRKERPALYNRLRAGWREVRRFPATVGDGEISVLRPRATP